MTERPPLRTVRRMPLRAPDALVTAAVAGAMVLTISVASEDGATEPDVLAYLLGLTVAALLPARRRWPMGVLIGSVGVLLSYFALGYPAFAPAVALAAATYYAALAGHIRSAAVLLAGVLTFGVGWQTLGEDASLASVVGTGTLADASLMAAVLLLGEAVRSRRAWAAEVRRRLARADADRERDAARRVEEERLRIARELHDVVAHTIAALNVQAGVAADQIDDEPEQAKAALRTVRRASREAIAELKATVGLLRNGGGGDAPRAPAPGLAGLDGLVRTAAAAGVEVGVSVAGAERPLPAAIDLTAYRIVQESLTNVVRHARACSVTVHLGYDTDALVVRVHDDGRGEATTGDHRGAFNGSPGYGLVGMRERAAALGGTLEAGPAPQGGFCVSARLPTGAP
jgi:signal transduction histidine kinase